MLVMLSCEPHPHITHNPGTTNIGNVTNNNSSWIWQNCFANKNDRLHTRLEHPVVHLLHFIGTQESCRLDFWTQQKCDFSNLWVSPRCSCIRLWCAWCRVISSFSSLLRSSVNLSRSSFNMSSIPEHQLAARLQASQKAGNPKFLSFSNWGIKQSSSLEPFLEVSKKSEKKKQIKLNNWK